MVDHVRGIDVSHFQGNIDWGRVAADGVQFAFTKATDGRTYVDPTFHQNWNRMRQAGLIRGVYHFLRPGLSAKSQADHFLNETKSIIESADFPPVLDVEDGKGISQSQLAAKVREWLSIVESAIRRKPIIYCSPGIWNSEVGRDFSEYPVWVAHYTSKPNPTLPIGWTNWKIWQFTDKGRVAGINGDVDLDRFNGSMKQLKAFIASTII